MLARATSLPRSFQSNLVKKCIERKFIVLSEVVSETCVHSPRVTLSVMLFANSLTAAFTRVNGVFVLIPPIFRLPSICGGKKSQAG
jgi:hypothetical protein